MPINKAMVPTVKYSLRAMETFLNHRYRKDPFPIRAYLYQ